MIRTLPATLRVLATTATANNRVMQDLVEVLGPNLEILRGNLDRSSLSLQTISLPSRSQRLAWLAQRLAEIPGSGIIYALTVRDANQVASWLTHKGFVVAAYTSETEGRRETLEQALQSNQVKALVATTSLGMGYDKPDLAFVIHYQMPGSAVAYYQQVGRAGRALDEAYGVLLSGEEEGAIADWFISSAFPTPEEVWQVIAALEAEPGGLSVPEILGRVNLRKGRVDHALMLLSLESPSPIARQDGKWQLTAATLGQGFWDRAERLTRLRRDEFRQMRDYVALPFGEHMAFLVKALDGDATLVKPPPLSPLSQQVDLARVIEADLFLRRADLPIEPRKKWPDGGLPLYHVKGRIDSNYQARPGRALCVWGDTGWGDLVRRGKYQDGAFADALIGACIDMWRRWNPQPTPAWVTCIPSPRHPELVPGFARRLSATLGLPFHAALIRTELRAEQKTMANSVQQARNIDGSLALVDGTLPSGPVLLIDDIVDSRWTFTVAAWLLRRGGSGDVWPMALAMAAPKQ